MTPEAPKAPCACPDAELLAAYVDGVARPAERTEIERHLGDCAECREVVAAGAAIEVNALDSNSGAHRARRRWPKAIATVLVAAAAVVVIVKMRTPTTSGLDLSRLVQAAGTERNVEPRLSGGFAYGRLPGPTRSGSVTAARPELRIAAAEADKKVQARRSAATLHEAGTARLLVGEHDVAVKALTEAHRLAPEPPIAVNLAAALIARARAQNNREDLTSALAILAGIAANPVAPEVVYNRALALDKLQRQPEALAAWREYLSLDANSGWASEAREHVARLAGGGG